MSIETADDRTLSVDAVSVIRLSMLPCCTWTRWTPIHWFLGADPAPGDDAWVVGYPRGEVRVTTGRVVDEVDGTKYGVSGRVIRTRAEADPGNSGDRC